MRLIDADAFDRTLEDAELGAKRNRKYVFASALNIIRGNLRNAPTIEERKKGKWIDKGVISNYPEEGFNNYHLLVCDQCGCMYRTTVWCENGKYINANFCPNCGADMRGEGNGTGRI